MALIQNLVARSGDPNQVDLSFDMPLSMNDTTDEVIVTRATSHFPVELYNPVFPTKATDSRPIEIYRASTIVGIDTGTISVVTDTITDTGAAFPTSPSLAGRLLRDSASQVFRITSNTATTITVDGLPTDGKYVVLPDFPQTDRDQQNFEIDIRTTVTAGSITNLVEIVSGSLLVAEFTAGDLANMFFRDGAGTIFIIKNNTSSTLSFYDNTSTPVIGPTMSIFKRFNNSTPFFLEDIFLKQSEADARVGTGLLDNTFYYYTTFTKPASANVAQAEFGQIDSGVTTQASAISKKDREIGKLLYEYWPSFVRDLDTTGDIEDLMQVFGFQLSEIHSIIDTYRLQDPDTVFVNALLPLSEQTGLPSVGFSIGADTLRRTARNLISCWKLKGTKEGIALFIRKITTWDITGGDADFNGAIQDFLPNTEALRFFDTNLGTTNTRVTETEPFLVPGGRFARSLPGIVIPGFFTFREFVITVPDVALFVGASEVFTVSDSTTTMTDTVNNFGADNSLVGNFLVPNQAEVNDIFEIVANTAHTITVKGIVINRSVGGQYIVLSPLNTNRFNILNKLLPVYIPFGTKAGFLFT